jgi:RNA polymerase sigma factor (sigma-70 family)
MRASSRRPARLALEDELRLAREIEDADASMARAIASAPGALGELGRVGERVRSGALRLRDVTRIAEHAPAAAETTRARVVAVLRRAEGLAGARARDPSFDEERRALASEIASLRLLPIVFDRAAAAMGEADAAARLAFDRAMRSSRRAKAEWTAASGRLVLAIAKRYRRPGVDTLDLVQDGTIGLIRAVERFDPRLGYRFHAYAAWWIRQHVFRALADYGRSIRVPLPMVEASHRVARTRRLFEGSHGREPGDEELAALSGLDLATVAAVDAIIDEPVSLQGRIGDEDFDVLDRLADGSAPLPDEQVALARLRHRVRDLFEALPPHEREVLQLRFGLDGKTEHSLVQVATSLGLSRERVRRIEDRALSRLRMRSLRDGLRSYIAA